REVDWIVTSEILEAIIGRIERWMGRRPYSKLHLLEIDRPRKDDCLRRDGWRFPASRLGGHQSALFLFSRGSNPLKADWQTHVLASNGYLELGMFDAAALVLEEIAPEDKTRAEVLGARVALYITAKKWDMAATVASHLVKVEPENADWRINLANSVRC